MKAQIAKTHDIDPGIKRPAERARVYWIWIVSTAACLAICLFVLFRPFWVSHFDRILSDPVDGRFSISILEHWNRVFRGQSTMASPGFFFPEHGVLGFSDAFFLVSLPHSALRYAGFDRYLAYQITVILLTVVGFISMLRSLHTVLKLGRWLALLGASLFTISNIYHIQIVHPQLVSVVFVPVLLVLAHGYWKHRDSNPTLARIYLSGASVLFALLFFTSFYLGWFTALFIGSVSIFFLACWGIAQPAPRPLLQTITTFWTYKWDLLLGIVAFGVALIPFLAVYLPALHRSGMRVFGDSLYYMSTPWGALDVGRDNIIWGWLSNRIEHLISPAGMHEHPAGWPPLTILVFLVSGLYFGIRSFSGAREQRSKNCFLLAVFLASLTLWFATTRFGTNAPGWAVLWRWVPGAQAIRVPQRMNLVLTVGIVTVCVCGIESFLRQFSKRGSGAYVVVMLAGVLMMEQFNSMPTHLISRSVEVQKFSKVIAPPIPCSEFYISSWEESRMAKLTVQVDAILIAEQLGLPTIDGYSGWFPKDWNLWSGNKRQMAELAREWSEEHKLAGLCALDLSTGSWSSVDVDQPVDLGQLVQGIPANGGFEDGDIRPWSIFQAVHARLSHNMHSGSYSLAEETAPGSVYQDIKGLAPNHSYTIAAWVSASPGATATAQIASLAFGAASPTFSADLKLRPEWQLLTQPVNAGREGALRVHLFRNQGSGTIYWDDVRIFAQ